MVCTTTQSRLRRLQDFLENDHVGSDVEMLERPQTRRRSFVIVQETLRPCRYFSLNFNALDRKRLTSLSVFRLLHSDTHHALPILKRHGFGIILGCFLCGIKPLNLSVKNVPCIGNCRFNFQVLGAIHDYDQSLGLADHDLVKVHRQWPLGLKMKSAFRIRMGGVDGNELTAFPILSSHPLFQFHFNVPTIGT